MSTKSAGECSRRIIHRPERQEQGIPAALTWAAGLVWTIAVAP